MTGPSARRRPLALLAILAAAGTRGITRERLVGILWPERPEDQARHVLSQSLYALRRDLGIDELIQNGGALRLNPAVITSDVQAFSDAIEAGDSLRAVELYAGPFLEGFYLNGAPSFEEWVETERARLAAQYARAVEAVALSAGRTGDHAGAAAMWERLAATDRLATRPILERARSLAASGDFAFALRHLREHAALLAQEGLPAPPELAALERQLDTRNSAPEVATQRPLVAGTPEASRRRRPGAVRAIMAATLAVLAVVAVLALVRTRAGARAVPIVGVGLMESHLPNDTLGLARSLPDLITTQLAQVPGLSVVSRGRLLEVLGGDASPGPGALSRGARAAGAHEIIEGALYPEPDGLRLDLRRVDLASGRAIGAVAVEAPDASLLVERAAAALASSFGLDAPVVRLADVTSVSLVARRFYEEGLRAFYAADHRAASRLFQAALADDPTFAMAAYYLAQCQDVGDPESVSARWRRASALASRATDRERLVILSGASFHLNDARLVSFAESLAIRYPDDLEGQYMTGELRLSEGDFEGAVSAYLEVARRDSASRRAGARCRSCDAMGGAIWASLLGDSLPRAERLARELVSSTPDRPNYHGLLWTVLLRREHYARAREVMARQNELAPRSASPRLLELLIALRGGDFSALDSITLAMIAGSEGGAELGAALEWRATFLREAGRLDDALDTARVARRVADSAEAQPSKDPFALLPQALALLHLGASDARAARNAARLFDSMAAMPKYPEPRMARHRVWMWTHRATALALAGDTAALPELEARIASMARFSSYGRDRRMPRYVRGLLLESRGDLEGAAAAYRAAAWSPTENHVSPRLARTLLRLHRPADAIPVLQAWLRGPLDAANQYVPRREAHRLLAAAFTAMGQGDSAKVHREWGGTAVGR